MVKKRDDDLEEAVTRGWSAEISFNPTVKCARRLSPQLDPKRPATDKKVTVCPLSDSPLTEGDSHSWISMSYHK